MIRFRVAAAALTLSLTLIVGFACSPRPYSIESEEFEASDACDAEGTYEVHTEEGRVTAKALGEIQAEFHQSAGFGVTLWCHGLRHVFSGRVEHGGYVLESDPENPLQFVVDRDLGYYYEKGAGTVTSPDGEQETFR